MEHREPHHGLRLQTHPLQEVRHLDGWLPRGLAGGGRGGEGERGGGMGGGTHSPITLTHPPSASIHPAGCSSVFSQAEAFSPPHTLDPRGLGGCPDAILHLLSQLLIRLFIEFNWFLVSSAVIQLSAVYIYIYIYIYIVYIYIESAGRDKIHRSL